MIQTAMEMECRFRAVSQIAAFFFFFLKNTQIIVRIAIAGLAA